MQKTKNQTNPKLFALIANVNIVVPKHILFKIIVAPKIDDFNDSSFSF